MMTIRRRLMVMTVALNSTRRLSDIQDHPPTGYGGRATVAVAILSASALNGKSELVLVVRAPSRR